MHTSLGRAVAAVLGAFGVTGRSSVIAIPFLWLFLFFLLPFVIVLKISLAEYATAIPPYSDLLEWGEDAVVSIKLNFGNFQFLLEDDLYWAAYLNSARIALISTLWCLLIGYPMAYAIARANPVNRNILLMLVILPFWTSFLLRVYAWMGILKNNGIINNILMGLGIIDQPIVMMQTDFAVYLGIVYSYLPFMILPLYANLEKLDGTLLEAAYDLGCKPFKTFLVITLPLSLPGIIAGSMLVFIPAVGEFVIPSLLGGPDTLMIGRVLWDEFFNNRDWPVASAVAIAMLAFLVVPIMVFQHYQNRQPEA
ncbi:Putrescine transport system permease protein PotH [Granulosicoccus antarcticus IMCC3135]|uniref:Putrescine transport system permease protein PotH n=2 Tax=Granulosicoccus TaxID=437504 RepID=A0A2Z2NWF4_9GAMM|nr:ABC transporter permease subunit [Granulosicoccus antarcticus]ASJ74048.1 Putrescine transport system permease protein PotH [Granulosicoccus antarcticus IMCC3135]